MKVSGIYRIQSKVKPERFYIGSSVNILARWQNHLSELKYNKHHSRKLQRHYNKYGSNDLDFSILIEVTEDQLIKVEQNYIDTKVPYFNECLIAGRCTGFRHTEETRKKMSEHTKGQKHTEETKNKISLTHIGVKKSKSARLKMSIAKKGCTPWNKGKSGIYSKETIEKIRIGHIGVVCGMVGKKHTEESKRKMSETRKARNLQKRLKNVA